MNNLSRRSSFTAANAYPFKIFKDKELLAALRAGKIIPIHVQLNPTNVCNLNCSFCSCSKREKHLALDFRVMAHLIDRLKSLGCKAVTVTGGGEPILYPNFSRMITLLRQNGINVGLVSNGEALGTVPESDLTKVTWCRISCSDDRLLQGRLLQNIEAAVLKAPGVDWAFSYVVTEKVNTKNLSDFIAFANAYNFTHVRVVSDLLNLEGVGSMDFVKYALAGMGADLSRVVFQGRKEYKPGQKKCLISLLKPNIGADGFIYPCCGVQYAKKDMDLDYAKSMRLGSVNEIMKIYEDQAHFDGSVCSRCYYSEYNEVLELLMSEMKHESFV